MDVEELTPSVSEAAPPAAATATIAHMLGEVCWVLSQSRYHKHFSLGDLEWMVMPPILANQFRVFHGDKSPVGFAIWAYVSEEVEARLREQVAQGAGARLKPEDWKSGDRLWLIELVSFDADNGKLTQAMLADVAANALAGKTFKFFAADSTTGKRTVREIGEADEGGGMPRPGPSTL